jgi:2-methylcitrate dehydratase PrpD
MAKQAQEREDAAQRFAHHIVHTRFEDIPPDAMDNTKRDILDTIGCALAGSSAPGTMEMRGLMNEWGGKPEATVVVYGDKIPSLNAALVNGAMAHARDFDDTYDRGLVHAGVSTVPAAFAIAERMGTVSGKELITACALGQDMLLRMVASVTEWNDFHATAIHGSFGATAAAGKLLGLDEETMISAFGIAYAQASGNVQAIHDGVLTKRLQAGHAARTGVFSALLAQRGFTGARGSLEGQAGFFNVFYGGNYQREELFADLGKRFEGSRLGFKPYPSAR